MIIIFSRHRLVQGTDLSPFCSYLIRTDALDWLGMGLSSRPSPKYFDLPPPAKTSNLTSEQLEEATALRIKERVTNAENFFGVFLGLVLQALGQNERQLLACLVSFGSDDIG